MQKAYRHGEILLLEVDEIPKEAQKSTSKEFAKGNTGNSHTIDNGELYFTEDLIKYGYIKAENTSLLHSEHSPKVGDAKIPDGNYQLIRQQEHTPAGLIPVID